MPFVPAISWKPRGDMLRMSMTVTVEARSLSLVSPVVCQDSNSRGDPQQGTLNSARCPGCHEAARIAISRNQRAGMQPWRDRREERHAQSGRSSRENGLKHLLAMNEPWFADSWLHRSLTVLEQCGQVDWGRGQKLGQETSNWASGCQTECWVQGNIGSGSATGHRQLNKSGGIKTNNR